jgi:hypothetical protein
VSARATGTGSARWRGRGKDIYRRRSVEVFGLIDATSNCGCVDIVWPESIVDPRATKIVAVDVLSSRKTPLVV